MASPSAAAPPSKEELLRAVRRQNRHAERAREAARAAAEAKVAELREAAEQCRATMTRLRAERDGGDYALARRRRDECLAEAAAVEAGLDPVSELAAVDAAITAAAARARAREAAEAAEYVAAARAVNRRLHPEPAVFPHARGWDRESRLAGEAILRRVDPEGDKDLDASRLVVGWTRFDFVPSVPWRKGRAQELETVGKLDGMLTYHTKKYDRFEQAARESRERLMSRGSSRGAPLATDRGALSSRGGGGGAGAGGGGFAGTAGLHHDAPGAHRPGSATDLLDSDRGAGPAALGAGTGAGSRPQIVTRPMSGAGGIVDVRVTIGGSRGRSRGGSRGGGGGGAGAGGAGAGSSSSPGFGDLGATAAPGGGGGHGRDGGHGSSATSPEHALPAVPSASVPRRTLTLRPLPGALLAALSPTLQRRPAHPAYLLKSEAAHARAWTKTDVHPQLFSRPPVERAPTLNEEMRARAFLQPDRATYDPKAHGRQPFLKTDLRPYPLFSKALVEGAWLELHGREEEKALVERFHAQLKMQDEVGYEGEDAFGGGGGGGDAKRAGAGSDAGAGGARTARFAEPASPPAARSPRGLPDGPLFDDRARLRSRESLAQRHPLGAVALREAEAAMDATLVGLTHRLQNRAGGGGGASPRAADQTAAGFGRTVLPPRLFTARGGGLEGLERSV